MGILQHPDRLVRWIKTGTCTPVTFEFSLREASKPEIPFKTYRKILISLKKMHIKSVVFVDRDEPLLHSSIVKILNVTNYFGFKVGVITSGLVINELTADVMSKRCSWVQVNANAATAEEYAKAHKTLPVKFTQLLYNLQTLKRYVVKNGSSLKIVIAAKKDVILRPQEFEGFWKSAGFDVRYLAADPIKENQSPSMDQCHLSNFIGFIDASMNVFTCSRRKVGYIGNCASTPLEALWKEKLSALTVLCADKDCDHSLDNEILSNIRIGLNDSYFLTNQ